jgi:hypothetical protein
MIVVYLGLIHGLSNLDLKLLKVSHARWSGVSAHKGMKLAKVSFFLKQVLKNLLK